MYVLYNLPEDRLYLKLCPEMIFYVIPYPPEQNQY